MNTNIIKTSIILLFSIFLLGCKQSEDSLLQHPETLKEELLRCESYHDQSSYCDKVKEIAFDFIKLANMREQDAESFGKKILESQQELAKLKEMKHQAKAEYKNAQEKKLADSEIEKAKEKLKMAEEAYKVQLQHVKILLAVVAATSSDSL